MKPLYKGTFDFLNKSLDHNIENNNSRETEIDRNIEENKRVSNNMEITKHNEEQLDNDHVLRRSTRTKRIPTF